MFEFKPYANNFVSLEEFEEFLSRLISESVKYHLDSQNLLFTGSKIMAQGDLSQTNLSFDEFPTQIVVNVDNNETNNKLVVNTDNYSKSYSVECDIAINIFQNDKADLDLKRMVSFFTQAFCFNNFKFSTQLTTEEGFSNKTYNCQLDQNKVKKVSKDQSKRILTILFKITQN